MKRCSCCMGLMGNSAVCPHCGYDNRRSQEIPYALPPGSVLQGKYLIGNVLGQGGFGITYLGFDMILEVKVAIKEYYVSSSASRIGAQNQQVYWMSDPGDMNHFITEARRMAKLDKMPEIAHVRDIFYANKTAYIIMEYVEGVSLNEYLQRTGVMSYEKAVKLMLPVIEALGRVHQERLVHRDISPDNLMMEPNGKLRVLDLGAAGDLTRNNAQATQMVARQGFSPYEQYLGAEKIGPHTDVYAVCATIYYCCTGKLLPDAMRRMEQYVRSRKADLEFDPVIPPNAVKVLRRGLALEAKDRISTMAILAEQLKKTMEMVPAAPAKNNIGQGVRSKVREFGKQIDQLKKELENEWGEESVQEEHVHMPSKPQQQKISEKKPKPKEEAANEFKANGKYVVKSVTKSGVRLCTDKKPLLAGVAALVIVIGIVAFGGREKQPEDEKLQISEKTAESTEAVRMPGDQQIISTETPENEETISHQSITEPTLDMTEPVMLSPAEKEEWEDEPGSGSDDTTSPQRYTENNVTYLYKETLTGITITGYEGELPEKLVLPSEIDGKKITAIGKDVDMLGAGVFRECTNLTEVVIPDGVTVVGYGVFSGCTRLENVTMPDSVISISSCTFENCTNLSSVTIPDSVISIGSCAFANCTSLKSIVIPDNVISISNFVFRNCSSLTEVKIPSSVTSWANNVFEDCTGLSKVIFAEGSSTIPFDMFRGCTNLTKVVIPETVKEICRGAFVDCNKLTEVTISQDCRFFGGFPEGKIDKSEVFPAQCKIRTYMTNDLDDLVGLHDDIA